jgi:spermidine/putrescine transport system permease protein
MSWVVVIVRGRLATIGIDVEEAAADLGAPPREIVRRVLLALVLAFLAFRFLSRGEKATATLERLATIDAGGATK